MRLRPCERDDGKLGDAEEAKLAVSSLRQTRLPTCLPGWASLARRYRRTMLEARVAAIEKGPDQVPVRPFENNLE